MEIKLHQIYFEPAQLERLDPAFTPYDNSQSPNPDAYEFYVFRKEHLAGNIDADAYTGYVSWKFGEKTGISGQKFIEFCEANPGYDVYFINPFPLDICYGNVWQQGEAHHPGLLDLARKLFDGAHPNADYRLTELPANLRTSGFCNFWAGNKKFWDAYMQFCLPFWDYIFERLSESERKQVFSRCDKRTNATYFAFFIERLFTTFLLQRPDLRACQYVYSLSELKKISKTEKEAALVNEIQKIEAEFENEAEPIKKSPALELALYYYRKAHERPTARELIYESLRWFWLALPLQGLRKFKAFNGLYMRLKNQRSNTSS